MCLPKRMIEVWYVFAFIKYHEIIAVNGMPFDILYFNWHNWLMRKKKQIYCLAKLPIDFVLIHSKCSYSIYIFSLSAAHILLLLIWLQLIFNRNIGGKNPVSCSMLQFTKTSSPAKWKIIKLLNIQFFLWNFQFYLLLRWMVLLCNCTFCKVIITSYWTKFH